MVGCDNCRRWFHSRCVSLKPSDKKPGKKWFCSEKECQQKKKPSKKSLDEPAPLPPAVQEQLKMLEEARREAEAEQEAARTIAMKELEMKLYL